MRLFSLFSAIFCASSFLAQEIWMTPNTGQWDTRIHYSVELTIGKLFLQKDGMCFMLTDFMAHGEGHDHHHSHDHEEQEAQRIHVIHQNFIGANTEAKRHIKKKETQEALKLYQSIHSK